MGNFPLLYCICSISREVCFYLPILPLCFIEFLEQPFQMVFKSLQLSLANNPNTINLNELNLQSSHYKKKQKILRSLNESQLSFQFSSGDCPSLQKIQKMPKKHFAQVSWPIYADFNSVCLGDRKCPPWRKMRKRPVKLQMTGQWRSIPLFD